MAKSKALQFDESDVKVLRNLSAVRAKPTMYIGPMDSYGISTIIREPGDNIVDEVEAGRASQGFIRILNKGTKFIISDDGQGIPVKMHPTEKLPTIQVLVSVLHAGGKLGGGNAYKNSRGTHGIGVKATNALSKDFRVVTFRDKKWWMMHYQNGNQTPVQELTSITAKEAKAYGHPFDTGTSIIFEPDFKLFDKGAKFEPDMLDQWCDLAAYLTPGLYIQTQVDDGEVVEYYHEGGVEELIADIAEDLKATLMEAKKPFVYSDDHCNLALAFSDADGNHLYGYCNGLHQPDGGLHVDFVRKSIYSVLREYANTRQTFTVDEVTEGLLGIINFRIDSPRFSSQTKEKLSDLRFTELCGEGIVASLEDYFAKDKALAKRLVSRMSELNTAKAEFKLAKKAVTELKKARTTTQVPTSVMLPKGAKPEDTEIYLVEGDSAGGTAKQACFKAYQGVVPCKGKIINGLKAKPDVFQMSQEVIKVLAAINYDPEAKDVYAKLPSKIIMLSDPDPDGYHINALILAALWVTVPKAFEQGRVYAVVSPKYILNDNGTQYTAMTLDELKDKLPRGVKIEQASYLKGWGEANPEAMRPIAFEKGKRQLIRITTPPNKKAIEYFEDLMGRDTESTRALLGLN